MATLQLAIAGWLQLWKVALYIAGHTSHLADCPAQHEDVSVQRCVGDTHQQLDVNTLLLQGQGADGQEQQAT